MSKFNVGDKVFDIRYGNGVVAKVVSEQNYPVRVKFDVDDNSNVDGIYTEDGKSDIDQINPLLYLGHDLKVVVKEKEYVYQVLYKRAGQELWNTSAEFYSNINDWRDAVLYSGEEAEAMFLECSKREVNDD